MGTVSGVAYATAWKSGGGISFPICSCYPFLLLLFPPKTLVSFTVLSFLMEMGPASIRKKIISIAWFRARIGAPRQADGDAARHPRRRAMPHREAVNLRRTRRKI